MTAVTGDAGSLSGAGDANDDRERERSVGHHAREDGGDAHYLVDHRLDPFLDAVQPGQVAFDSWPVSPTPSGLINPGKHRVKVEKS